MEAKHLCFLILFLFSLSTCASSVLDQIIRIEAEILSQKDPGPFCKGDKCYRDMPEILIILKIAETDGKKKAAKESLSKTKKTLESLQAFGKELNYPWKKDQVLMDLFKVLTNRQEAPERENVHKISRVVENGLDGLFCEVNEETFHTHDFYEELVDALNRKFLFIRQIYMIPIVGYPSPYEDMVIERGSREHSNLF